VIDKLEKQIGFGSNGKIFKAVHIRTNVIRAIKAVPILSDPSNNSSLSSDLQIGMELSKRCSYLVRYYSVFEEGDFQIIVMDYIENGDLRTYIKNNKLAEKVFLFLFRTVLPEFNFF
jgi:serine/threonine protein kinase